MNEVIERIEIVEGLKIGPEHPYGAGVDGYRVVTNKHEYLCGIDNNQRCCENWGYLWKQDDNINFIGAALEKIEVLGGPTRETEDMFDYADGMFIYFHTSQGTLQFTAYNEHNGYYSHSAFVLVDGIITYKEDL